MQALIVIEPFGQYAKGDKITDADAMKAAQADNPHRVVRINEPDAPETTAKPSA